MFVAIYLRLSKDEQQLGVEEVLSNHRLALTRIADSNGWKYDIYEEVSSGVNTEREEINLLLQRIDDYSAVLCMDVDRLSRDNSFAEQIKKQLILHGVKLITPQGEYDFDNENSDMLYSFQSMFANFEYKQIRKRLSRGKFMEASKGLWVMNNVPLGFKKNQETKKLEVNEEEAHIIRYIFDKTLEGFSINRISRDVYDFGWRSRRGKILSTSHLSNIRQNPTYYGVVRYERKNEIGKVLESCFIENAHEALIPKQRWLEAQKIIKNNSNKKFTTRGKISRALQGLIYCGCCGHKRYICRDATGKDYIKACGFKVQIRCNDAGYRYLPIEEAVFKWVKEYIPELKEELSGLKNQDTGKVEKVLFNQLKDVEVQLAKRATKRKNFTNMRAEGEITKAEFEEVRGELEEEVTQLNQQKELLELKLENVTNNDEQIMTIEKRIETLENLEKLSPEEVNAFLRQFIKKVVFSRNIEGNPNTTGREEIAPTVEIIPL
ncbi:resolvase [Bacillus pseudomycoides]|nr:resolvase [Bacillus pseudomycoides]